MAESQRDYWDNESALPLDASVIDRNDRRGLKNRHLAWLRNRAVLEAVACIGEDEPILDFGCGNGSLSEALVTAGHRVVGLDISPGLLARSAERNTGDKAAFVLFDGHALPVSDRGVAAITTYVVLNHIVDDAQLARVLGELRRVLKPGGILVAVEQVRRRQRMDVAGWKKQRTLQEFVALFEAAGFHVHAADVIRYGRFLTTPLIRLGLVPSALTPTLAIAERFVGRIYGIPLWDYCDVRFVLN